MKNRIWSIWVGLNQFVRSGCSRQTETVYFFTLLQDAGWLPALLGHHNNDNRRRKPDGTEIESIKKCEGVRNERIQVQTDTDNHAEGSVAEGTRFDIGGYVSVSCENGRLVITPDTERAALKEAEAAFMERETKLLQKRFEVEKERLRAQFVAERQAQYGGAEKEA